MSSTFLRIISTDPSFDIDKDLQEKARTFLFKIYQKEQIEFINTDTIEFVDQGENFENVSCNLCNSLIETEVWQNAMDNAYKNEFKDLFFITPCCNKITSLNNLDYNWPAGFAKSIISISEPQNGLAEKELEELEGILKTDLRNIWAHY
jgi:hypothetical protein